MDGKLIAFLEELRNNSEVRNFDEADTGKDIILRLLHMLGWNIFDKREVKSESPVENKRVDYSLRLSNTNEVFIENSSWVLLSFPRQ